ncbi:MAG: SEC-C metal-binding domain-containing protein, partial [Pseudomonadota bacterium]
LKFDDVMNDQRKTIFEQRREVMEQEDLADTVRDMRHSLIEDLVAKHIPKRAYAEQWDTEGLQEEIQTILAAPIPVVDWAAEEGVDDEVITERLIETADKAYAEKEEGMGADMIRQLEKQVLLQILDHHWREHLVQLDQLRSVIGLRGYAQRDPLNEYKTEAFQLFESLLARLRRDVTRQMSMIRLLTPEEQAARERQMAEMEAEMRRRADEAAALAALNTPGGSATLAGAEDDLALLERASPQQPEPGRAPASGGDVAADPRGKVGRNEPCPCGSGKKFKHCHGRAI